MKYVLILDVAKGKSMFMLSSNVGEVLLEPTEYIHNKKNFELIDSNINKLNIKEPIKWWLVKQKRGYPLFLFFIYKLAPNN